MKHREKGVLENSTMVFHTPSTTALQYLFFLNYIGFFHCDSNYRITRGLNEMYEPYLFLLVKGGNIELDYEGNHFEAGPGECLFIDCRKPHSYYTTSKAVFQYTHFGGNLSDYYYQRICHNNHHCFRAQNPEALSACFSRIEEEADQKMMNEHLISAYIHTLLSLALSNREDYITENYRRVTACTKYMQEHIEQPISLQILADHVHVSPYYLSRIFKKYTDSSPGDYLLNLRLSHGKMLLMTTSYSVACISEMCGFNNPTHFIQIFKRKIGLTPLQYRKTHMNP